MKKALMKVEFEFDDELMYGSDEDEEAKQWFYEEILFGENLVLVDIGDIGDELGKIEVLHVECVR